MNEEPALKLVYMADPMCSWCWGFSSVMNALRDEYTDRLDIDIVMGGLRAGNTAAISASQRQTILRHWEQVAEHAGAEFSVEGALPEGFIYDTEPGCRAVVTARAIDPTLTMPMLAAIQHAFYAQSRDVTRADVLCDIASETGIDRQEFMDRLESDGMRQAAEADFRRAREAGVNGYPALCLQRSWQTFPLFVGYQPLEDARTVVERVLTKFG